MGTFFMAQKASLYDLLLLLSTTVEDEQRAKILSDVEAQISASGSIERNDQWGTRAMTYEINHQKEAEYHLLQFSGPTTLLEGLSHSLRITDGVLRFRIIKVLPGTPAPPESAPPVTAVAAAEPSEFTRAEA
jgi:small subunit ribosomal protein S6